MVSLQWLEPFDEGQWLVVADRCLIAFSFCCCGDPSDFVSEVDLFAEQRFVSGVPPLAPDITVCLSQLFGSWVH
jgi:hypothetical protein